MSDSIAYATTIYFSQSSCALKQHNIIYESISQLWSKLQTIITEMSWIGFDDFWMILFHSIYDEIILKWNQMIFNP